MFQKLNICRKGLQNEEVSQTNFFSGKEVNPNQETPENERHDQQQANNQVQFQTQSESNKAQSIFEVQVPVQRSPEEQKKIRQSNNQQSQIFVRAGDHGFQQALSTIKSAQKTQSCIQSNQVSCDETQKWEYIKEQDQQSLANNSNFSIMIDAEVECRNCQQKTNSSYIQLACQHHFHIECLKELLLSQSLKSESVYFQCICTKKISTKTILSLRKDDFIATVLNKMNINQLKQLISNYEGNYIWTCPSKYCIFFCVIQNNLDYERYYCPNCLQYYPKNQNKSK